eukprot:223787-Lingulodinium_polyedra.AAC.1
MFDQVRVPEHGRKLPGRGQQTQREADMTNVAQAQGVQRAPCVEQAAGKKDNFSALNGSARKANSESVASAIPTS